MKLGFLPQPSDPPRLRALVGPARAKMILMAGQKIAAPDALAWGLLDRIVEPEDMLNIARALGADAIGGHAVIEVTRGGVLGLTRVVGRGQGQASQEKGDV